MYFLIGKPKDMREEILNIPLKSGQMTNWLVISNRYFLEQHGNYITIHVEYPEFMPNDPKENFSMEKVVRILLESESGIENDEVETFLKHTKGKGCNLNDICFAELISKTEQYETFESIGSKDKSKYYYFEAYDGQHILLEESGVWARSFRVKRNIDGYLHVDYQFPVKAGRDFVKIDKEVTEFIKNHLKFKHFEKG